MKIKRLTLIFLLFSVQQVSAQTLTGTQTGSQGGYTYEFWKDNNTGTGSMTLGEGGDFTCNWSNISNILFRKGLRPGIKNQVITYSANYNPNGNSYLAVYGWTKNPLVEYYIVESWGSWRPPGGNAKTTINVDGDKYDIYETTRVNQPSIEGNSTFQQFWSVRQAKRADGTIHCEKHFNTWDSLGMKMGSMYEVSFVVEGYQSSGSADVKMSMLTGSTLTNNTFNKESNSSNNKGCGANYIKRFEFTGNTNKTIAFSISSRSYVSVKLFDFIGKEIAEVGRKEYNAGTHTFTLNTSNLANGIYFYSVKTENR